eukprot:TRINITY_DN153_c0_g1_i12.p1 TRINITY_DN153_c0_g1~~TRINITY_DN153_c0_g1_i12.p1  ORF type:complete len:880 (+),score=307.94 TRINITY_DN153_c0_g1_i12:55-2640(+)
MRACLSLIGLTFALLCEGHHTGERGFWDSFVRRQKFKGRLLYHPDTGVKLRETAAAACNLTGAWTGQRINSRDDEYIMFMPTPTTFTVQAVTGGNWSTGSGTYKSDTQFIHVDLDKSSVQGITVNGTVINCDTIAWNNGWTWKKQQQINKVHVVFMNHLDVGYGLHTPEGNPIAFMANVINSYTSEYFPNVATLANTMRVLDPNDRFIYTTHPWLVSLYLDCPPNVVLADGTKLFCPTEDEKQAFAVAVSRGDIVWHDGPFNLQSEAVGWGGFFEWGLELTNKISEELGMSKPKNKVYNLRDVPGTTRAVVPWLVKNGFTAITVGQNPGTPATGGWYPHKVFLWKDEASGTEILAMNHAGGYPDDPGPSPEDCGGLCREDCMMFDGFDEALCFAFRTDNSGPPTSVEMVMNIYQILRVEFPGADVFASTLHAFTDSVNSSPLRKNLEVVTQEIGDTWIQGTASDPMKYAKYRAFVREMEACTNCNISDFRILNATRMLLTIPEHTAGLPGAGNYDAWTNQAFTPIRMTDPDWTNQNSGWSERRTWIDLAVQALADHPVRPQVEQALKECELSSSKPSTDGFVQSPIPAALQCDGAEFRFTSSCALDSVVLGGTVWADEQHLFGDLVYSTYTNDDFDNMAQVYVGPTGTGCGYNKPNMTTASGCTRGDYRLQNTDGFVWVKTSAKGQCQAICRAAFDSRTFTFYGGPQEVWTEVTVVSKSEIQIRLMNYNKTTTRLAEAMHYSFYPVPQDNAAWKLNKLGKVVSPYDTIVGGNPKQHSVYPGVTYSKLQINAMDASVVSPITPTAPPTPFLFSMLPIAPGTITGMAYNLWNNIWNTNYPFYYPFKNQPNGEENVLSRFVLKV